MALKFGGRLFVVILFFLLAALPLGTIIMAIACNNSGKLEVYDWVFSLFVPFYGPAVALFAC